MKSRSSSNLPASLDRRLSAYALAAGAAGVSLAAVSVPAEARIVYTPAHQTLSNRIPFPLDLNHDGITDFSLFYSSYSHFFGVSVTIKGKNQVAGYCQGPLGYCWASAIPARVRVGQNQRLGPFSLMLAGRYFSSRTSGGPWKNVHNRYLGLKFFIKGKVHYGWARLTVAVHSPLLTVTLTGYAYETIPNKPIITGKTKGPYVITLEPATLGRLAQGASGISA